MKKTLNKIVTMLLVVTMVFGAMSTTVAAASDALQGVTDKASGVLGGDPAPDSGSVATGWCDISYDENGVTVVLTPGVDEIKGVTKEDLKSVLAIIIDAAKSLVIDELKDEILGSDDTSDDNVDVESGTDKNNIWEKAFSAYIKNEYGSDSSENYIEFLKDILADDTNVKLDNFIDYACKLLKSSVNLGMIKLEDLPASSEIENKITELFEDELNTRLNEEATKYVNNYVAWLEGDNSVTIEESVKNLIDGQVKSYIKTEINEYLGNSFTVPVTSQDPVDNIIADYVEDEIRSNVDLWIRNYAAGIPNGESVDNLIEGTITEWVEGIAQNYRDDNYSNPIYNASLKAEVNALIAEKLDEYIGKYVNNDNTLDSNIVAEIENQLKTKCPQLVYDVYWTKKATGYDFAADTGIWGNINEQIRNAVVNEIVSKTGCSVADAEGYFDREPVESIISQIGEDGQAKALEAIADHLAGYTRADWKSVWEDSAVVDQNTKDEIVASVKGSVAFYAKAQTEIINYWNEKGNDELNKVIQNTAEYNNLLDNVIDTAKSNYKSTVSGKINEQLDGDGDIALTLREIISNLDATQKAALKDAINQKATEKIGEIKDEAFKTVFGKTEAEIKEKIETVLIPRLTVKYDATLEELKNKPESEFATVELLSYIKRVSLNGNDVYLDGSIKASAVKALLGDIPRIDEIANMSDADMYLSYDVEIVTDFGDIAFNVTARLGGGYSYVRKIASFICEYVDFHTSDDGTIVFNVRVPELLAEILLRAITYDKIPDEVKKEIFGAVDTSPNELFSLITSITLDDLLLIFDYIDIETVLDHELLSRFERLDGLTEEQIKNKIKEYESYYNKLMDYVKAIYNNRVPDAVKEMTVFDLYCGNGEFAYSGTHTIPIEAILTRINEKYGALIALFFDVSTVTASVDFSIDFAGINKIEYVIGGELYLRGFLPRGADIEYFAGITEYNGEIIYGWADADGNIYTEMPNEDITLYAILAPDIPDIPDVWFDSFITPSTVEKTYDGEAVELKVNFAEGVIIPEGAEVVYQWIRVTDDGSEGQIIENATSDTLYVRNVADSGNYVCVIGVVSEADMYFAMSISETCTVTINKATIDLNKYEWKQDGDVYDGTEKSIYLYDKIDGNKLTFGVEYVVNGEYTNVATNAGVYVAAIKIDEDNFTLLGIGISEIEWEIKKATYDMSGVRFDDKTVKYDGQPHSITIDESKLPAGVNVEYSGNSFVDPGKYEITATFIGSSNYESIEPMTATLTILGYNKNPQSIKDSDGNLIVEIIPENGVLEIYSLLFKDVTTNYTYLKADDIFGEGKVGVVGAAYDIHFAENGIEQPVNDNFRVKLLIPAALRNSEKELMVVYIADDGDITDMNATRDGDYMVFDTTHFSVYAIVEVEDAPKPMADVDLTWLWILIAVLVAIIVAAVIIIIIIKKRKSNGDNEPASVEPAIEDEPKDNTGASEETVTAEEPIAEPVEEAPVSEEPVAELAEEAPVSEEPIAEPVEEAPVSEEPIAEPAEEAPVSEEPVAEPAEEVPVSEEPIAEPVEEAPAKEEPKIVPAPVIKAVGEEDGEGERIINGEVVHVRYRTSFMSRLIQAEEPIQDYYTVVKNALLSYKGVKARTSWNFESFNKGRIQCAKLNVKGSAFQVYLGLDPNEYNANKYHFVDVSDKPKLDKVPMLLKVKSERGLKYVLELIEEMMNKLGMERIETPNVDYHMPYETTEALAERDLVKVILPTGVTLDGDENIVKVDVGELIDNANAEKAEREAGEVDEEKVVSEDFTAQESVIEERATEEVVVAEDAVAEEPVEETVPETNEDLQSVTEPSEEEPVEELHVDAAHADEIISDEEAKTKIEIVEKTSEEKSKSKKQVEINLDTICENFEDGDVVNLSALKAKHLISGSAGRIKILARGVMTKKLTIYADKFSLQAVKMITLAGGHADQYK